MNELAEAQAAARGGGVKRSTQRLELLCRVQSIDLSASVVAYDGSNPIGIALAGRRADRGWLYEVAVAPAYRRRGIGSRMIQAVIEELERAGTHELELDVAASRRDARTLFARLGFKRTRSYLSFAAGGEEMGLHAVKLPPGWSIVAGSTAQLITAYSRAQLSEPEPCWGRSLASLLAYPGGRIVRLIDGDRELALIFSLARAPSGGDAALLRPLFLNWKSGVSVEALPGLIAAAAHEALGMVRDVAVRFALEPVESSVACALCELRMPVVDESYDMRLVL